MKQKGIAKKSTKEIWWTHRKYSVQKKAGKKGEQRTDKTHDKY